MMYGGEQCVCCGETILFFFAIDHIEGGGSQQKREAGISGGTSFYKWLKDNDFPPGYRVLCHNCNSGGIETEPKTKYARYRRKLKLIVFNHYGGARCICCGANNLAALTLDHIDNNGQKQRIAAGIGNRAGSPFYQWLKKNNYPPGLQVLCFNCNIGRYHNGGICPHKDDVNSSSLCDGQHSSSSPS